MLDEHIAALEYTLKILRRARKIEMPYTLEDVMEVFFEEARRN